MAVTTTKANGPKPSQTPGQVQAQGQTHPHGQDNDIADMAKEIGIAVAAGLVPFVGQAINVYDTVDSLLTLRNSKNPAERAEAKFDLVLAIVGWVPGAGGGVKKTLRIVNKNPDRYAPIMFDVLRMVLLKLEIRTSPEALLAQLFDAPALQRVLVIVQRAIEESWLYEKMPRQGQLAISASLGVVRAELPAMVRLVANKLMHWKSKQRNNAARKTVAEKKAPALDKPDKKDASTATKGAQTPTKVPSNGVGNTHLGTVDLTKFTKKVTGILGEHITDYFLLEKYHWGKDWTKHDVGDAGTWKVSPGLTIPGKLNDGTKLNELFPYSARGTGIDGVWRVATDSKYHNKKKKYAIVESKASIVSEDHDGKPNIDNKLGHNKRKRKPKVVQPGIQTMVPGPPPKADELLEPDTSGLDSAAGTTTPASAPTTPAPTQPGHRTPTNPAKALKKRNKKKQKQRSPEIKRAKPPKETRVQMSNRWVFHNLVKAVGLIIANDIRLEGYSRHLFYTPFYLPSAIQHAKAVAQGNPEDYKAHEDHEIPTTHRYDEDELRAAVMRKLGLLDEPPDL
ncbi:MAG: hypothetical protein WKG03_00865 [Telluria sp.]